MLGFRSTWFGKGPGLSIVKAYQGILKQNQYCELLVGRKPILCEVLYVYSCDGQMSKIGSWGRKEGGD